MIHHRSVFEEIRYVTTTKGLADSQFFKLSLIPDKNKMKNEVK